MGSGYSWRLTVEDRTPDFHQRIISVANGMKDFSDALEPRFENWLWFRWTPEVKWSAEDFVNQLSKKFPEVVFRLECGGDEHFNSFIMNGDTLDEKEIWKNPPFPSHVLFKKKAKEAKIKRLERQRLQQETALKYEKQRMKNELEILKGKQKILERQLAE